MCEYCEATYNDGALTVSNLHPLKEQAGPVEIIPARYPYAENDLGEPLSTAAVCVHVDRYTGSDYYPINFCPMCGRDLREYSYQKPELHMFKVEILDGEDGKVLESFEIEEQNASRVTEGALDWGHDEYGIDVCVKVIDEDGNEYIGW